MKEKTIKTGVIILVLSLTGNNLSVQNVNLQLNLRTILLHVISCDGLCELTANVQGLWKVGALKLVRPNVCRYKLLMFSYLQMFSRFPSAETNVQKNY